MSSYDKGFISLYQGTKRAVMIGINYVGQDGELSGCHNDVKHVSIELAM